MSEISTYQKAKDAALLGFIGVAATIGLANLYMVADLRVQFARWQERQDALKEQVAVLRSELDSHKRDDLRKFAIR